MTTIKVYWVEDDIGRMYVNARYFAHKGMPKLYTSPEIVHRSIGKYGIRLENGKMIKFEFVIKEGKLMEVVP